VSAPLFSTSDFTVDASASLVAETDRLLAHLDAGLGDLDTVTDSGSFRPVPQEVPEQPLHDRADRHRSITRIDTPRRRA